MRGVRRDLKLALVGSIALVGVFLAWLRSTRQSQPKLVAYTLTKEAAAPPAEATSSSDAAEPAVAAVVAEPAPAEPASDQIAVGAPVKLSGLKTKPALNGKFGVVVGFDERKARYNVRLADNKVRPLRAANLEQVSPSDAVAPPLDGVPLQPSAMSAAQLVQLTLGDAAALTPAHGDRILSLLRSQVTPLEAGNLLRCCVCFRLCCSFCRYAVFFSLICCGLCCCSSGLCCCLFFFSTLSLCCCSSGFLCCSFSFGFCCCSSRFFCLFFSFSVSFSLLC